MDRHSLIYFHCLMACQVLEGCGRGVFWLEVVEGAELRKYFLVLLLGKGQLTAETRRTLRKDAEKLRDCRVWFGIRIKEDEAPQFCRCADLAVVVWTSRPDH